MTKVAKRVRSETPLAEWIAAGIGAGLFLATIGFLVYQGVNGRRTPPELRVEALSVDHIAQTYRTAVRVTNTGSETAVRVVVSGEVLQDGQVIDRATATLDYVAGASHSDGGLIFTVDPRQHTLKLRAVGYELP